MDPNALEKLNRDELIAKARQLGANRPELLTRPELRDEIIRLSESDDNERRRARGWFGVARDLVASVVSQGLNLPDTAELIRGANVLNPRTSPPVATVTLAEIYAAQGHVRKALDLLDEVLTKEPDHDAARFARARWSNEVSAAIQSSGSEGACAQGVTESVGVDPQESAFPLSDPQDSAAETIARPAVDAASAASVSSSNDEAPAAVVMEEERLAQGTGAEQGPEGEATAHEPDAQEVSTEQASAQGSAAAESVAEDPAIQLESMDASVACVGAGELAESMSDSDSMLRGQDLAVPSRTDSEAKPREDDVAVPPGQVEIVEDWLLVVRAGGPELHCCWQVGEDPLSRIRMLEPSGSLVLRVIEVAASWEGPATRESDMELTESLGHRRVELKDAAAEIRVALGWRGEQRFTVLAVGAEFAWDHVRGAQLRWALPATEQRDSLQRIGAAAVARMMQSVEAA